MRDFVKYAYVLIIVLAIPVWIAAVWNYIKMLGQVRHGNFWILMFNPLWWLRKHAAYHLTDEGLGYHRRTVRLIAAFLVMVFLGIVMGFAMVVL